ncbi:response regulator transcription factor [Muricomes intestini]|uniref:response regulator transcription factor n=1 Tax=Muricomes intestini TaxID=1796634 RepID=UPI002FE23865
MNVLIVEDEVRLADALREIMLESKYLCDVVYTGTDGLDYAVNGNYDVVILDVMLPQMDGFSVVQEMRKQGIQTPVLLLTAKDDVSDKIDGLNHGADDYMTKPFEPGELLARIRALSRRTGDVILEELQFGDLLLVLSTNDLWCKGRSIHLSFKEFEILKILMINSNILISKDSLIENVWGNNSDAEDNNVEAYISFLRKKFYYLGSQVGIIAVRKVGYRLEEKKNA